MKANAANAANAASGAAAAAIACSSAAASASPSSSGASSASRVIHELRACSITFSARHGRPISAHTESSPMATSAAASTKGQRALPASVAPQAVATTSPLPAPPAMKLAAARPSHARWCTTAVFMVRSCSWRRGRRRLFVGVVPQVEKARPGTQLFVHAEELVLGQQLRHVALRVVEVTECQGVGDARVDAGR